MFTDVLAATGDTTVKERLLKGWAPQAGDPTFRVHLDA